MYFCFYFFLDLLAEGNKLKVLLGYEIKLNTFPDVPLFTTKKQLNEELDKFRRIIEKRREEIQKLRDEEIQLCLGMFSNILE